MRGRRILIAACGAHFLQDGLVALQYVLLPILAQAFGLNYTQVGFLRAVSNSAMTLLEIPAGVLSERFGETRLLFFGLLCASLGYLGVALASSFHLIVIGFLIAGSGAAFQHSLSSALIANGIHIFGHHPKDNSPQGIFCANGQCSQCMVIADGLPVKACMTAVKENMIVQGVKI